MMYVSHDRGVTLVEIIVTVAILSILSVISYVTFQNINRHSALRVSAQDVKSVLVEARNKTLASENATVYGVHIDTTEVVMFAGATYDPAGGDNATTTFVGDVVATSSLSGGATDIVFERLTGHTTATGTVSVIGSHEIGTTTFTIYETGLVE